LSSEKLLSKITYESIIFLLDDKFNGDLKRELLGRWKDAALETERKKEKRRINP
jgi:hypothetical protein